MTVLLLTAIIAILFIIITFSLLIKINSLYKKLEYVDEANMWHRLAITDGLTKVYNRNAYNMRLINVQENITKKSCGIIIFDVDDFKKFNDKNGHFAGDEVLKKVAKILLDVFPEPDYRVFRIGGDEFSVVAEDVLESEIIERLIVLRKNLDVDKKIHLSHGYSIVEDNVDKAFKYADEMLYADKLSKNYSLYL